MAKTVYLVGTRHSYMGQRPAILCIVKDKRGARNFKAYLKYLVTLSTFRRLRKK